jgi:hypothetical protein
MENGGLNLEATVPKSSGKRIRRTMLKSNHWAGEFDVDKTHY